LWMLVNFEIWQRRFFDGEPDSGVGDALGQRVGALAS